MNCEEIHLKPNNDQNASQSVVKSKTTLLTIFIFLLILINIMFST